MGFFTEFKEFAVKGNVMDLAVGVIIGAAFGKIVDSIVNDLIMPLVGKVVGGLDFSNYYIALAGQAVFVAVAANRRHGIGDEEHLARRLGADCRAQAGRMHVMAIDDQAAPAVAVIQRRADRTGFAPGQRRHRIEQMGYALRARIEPCHCSFIGTVAMAETDNHTAFSQFAHLIRRHLLGSHCHQ